MKIATKAQRHKETPRDYYKKTWRLGVLAAIFLFLFLPLQAR